MTIRWRPTGMTGSDSVAGAGHGNIEPWLPHANASVFSTHTGSPDLNPVTTFVASSAIRWRGSFPSSATQKNCLQGLRTGAYELVRQNGATSTRPVLCRHTDLPGVRGTAHPLFLQRQSETRASGLPGRQPALQQAVCLVRLLSHRENLTADGRKSLKTLLAANKRLNTAYLLKESFGQLWDYKSEAWARKFFENWKASLKWQRLKPYEKFAEMIERHRDGIAAYCRPENKVWLGFVEGLNNKIRVFQRRAYGLRDEEYLRLKVLTSMLPAI